MRVSSRIVTIFFGLLCTATLAQAQNNPLVISKGLYKCELNRQVNITDVAPDSSTATIQWGRRGYVLHAVPARTGALRYEDVDSGLTWLVVVGKSMLLDTKLGRQLANECKV